MITEIKEEIGLDVAPDELQLIFSGRQDLSQVFFDIYYLKKDFDIDSLTLQKEEVDFVQWNSISEIENLIESGLFLDNHSEEFYRIIDILKIKETTHTL